MPIPPSDLEKWTDTSVLLGRPVTPPMDEKQEDNTSNAKVVSTTLKRSSRVPSKSEASALEHETKGFLGRRSGIALRAAEYRPTLEKIKKTSFSDYVRGVMIGVPLEGVEYEEPYFPDVASNAEEKKSFDGNINSQESSTAHMDAQDKPICPGTPHTKKHTHSPPTVDPSSENVRSKKKKDEPTRMKTRSQSRPKKLTYDKTLTVEQLRALRARRRKRRPSPLQPCKHKMADGLAKITFPEGWWDKSGIARDTTARGRRWQRGSKLGDIEVVSPIKQCASGIGGVYEFTMVDQPTINVADFRDKADAYRKRQIGSEFDEDLSDDFIDELARKFWRRLGPTMEAPVYGADMEGTFFGNANACGWNVNKLESCLQLLTVDSEADDDEADLRLPGVTTAYLYFGMWASVFAAHTEDKNLLSINYLHAGAPKYWYSISPDDSDRFESLMASHFSAAAAHCSEFLRHKRYLLSPSILNKAGIKYRTQIQRPGDAIITFPGSYHFGFNTGFNVAESTNFAVPEWYPIGAETNVCMCHPHSVRIDMNKFKELLDLYETDMVTDGISKMSYSEWVKMETRFRRSKKFFESSPNEIEQDSDQLELREKHLKTKGIVVEVLKMESRQYNSMNSPPKKKQKSLSQKKKDKKDDWRLALRVKPVTLNPQTPVLCCMSCENQAGDNFFSGVITDVVEGHVRIHFTGTGRKEDVWMTSDNPKIFLDAGPEEPPSLESLKNMKNSKVLNSGKGSQKSKAKKINAQKF